MKKLSFLMIAALFMAACSNNDELLNNENLNGKVTVTATLPGDAPNSRVALTEATDDNSNPIIKVSWDETESFSVIRGTENKTYSKSTAGNTFTGDAHTTVDGTYYAFYPANGTATATDAMPYDLSEQTGALDKAKTYMYAKSEDGKKYEFRHLTALVKFTLALPEGTTDVTPSKVVISSEKLQPVGTVNLTAADVTYTLTANVATSITITPTEGDESLIFYAYVTPMSASDSDKNTFVISMDGSDGKYYSGTLETSKSIEANYLYTASVNMICVEKGDFAMKDGSFIKYDANATLTDEQKAEVAGIVFWTTADMNTDANAKTPAKLTDDVIMATDFPNCTHGLILSLMDVVAGTKWQETDTDIASWQESNAFNPENKSDYKSVASRTAATALINYILGYQNTEILKAYNASLSDADAGKKVLPVSLLETFSTDNPAPANTTGWFIPSVKELTLLYGFDADDVWNDTYIEGSVTKLLINEVLNSWNSGVDENYWSSSEDASNERYAFSVHFDDGNVILNFKERNTFYVRAVCAY